MFRFVKVSPVRKCLGVKPGDERRAVAVVLDGSLNVRGDLRTGVLRDVRVENHPEQEHCIVDGHFVRQAFVHLFFGNVFEKYEHVVFRDPPDKMWPCIAFAVLALPPDPACRSLSSEGDGLGS